MSKKYTPRPAIAQAELNAKLRQVYPLGGEARYYVEVLRAMALGCEQTRPEIVRTKSGRVCNHAEIVEWLASHAAFHDATGDPLPEVLAMGEHLGKTGIRLAVEAMPEGYRHELNLALTGVRGWRPLAKFERY